MSLATAPRAGVELDIVAAGAQQGTEVLTSVGVSPTVGLSAAEVDTRREVWGPNAVSSHWARFCRSSTTSCGRRCSVCCSPLPSPPSSWVNAAMPHHRHHRGAVHRPGFVDEYRAEKAAEALHDQIHHEAVVIRDGRPVRVNVTELVRREPDRAWRVWPEGWSCHSGAGCNHIRPGRLARWGSTASAEEGKAGLSGGSWLRRPLGSSDGTAGRQRWGHGSRTRSPRRGTTAHQPSSSVMSSARARAGEGSPCTT